jgi:trehalose synthase
LLQPVSVGHKALGDYRHLIGRALVDEIQELAAPLAGKKVLHVSATAMGGGVSEILYAMVPLMRDAGLGADWHIVLGREEFFNVTKLLHNALQGDPRGLTRDDWEIFDRYNKLNADEMDADYDFVIVHDPQPAALMRYVTSRNGASRDRSRWIWRCHIDLSTPNQDSLSHLVPMVEGYDCKVFHLPSYVPTGVNGKVEIVPPAIDPLSPKNMALSPEDAAFVCDQFGVDVDRPLICQVSRFDPWKDPLGVIDAYRMVKEKHEGVQLALVGSMATDDPEGWDFFQKTHEHAGGDEDIKILNNLNNVGAIEVNAFQSQADVLVQKSTREGFGLTVSEALWKARPTVAGNVGGIPLQITDRETGFLVSSADEAAAACIEVLDDPELGKRLGRAGKEHVRTHFLMPRLLRDWLKIFNELS